ncbi:MAG: SBBP repeat-containing protein [Saprospiraceae bacterium]|nr:SBBP repeat-containing protein [Candidatus Vicinibacter affinis]
MENCLWAKRMGGKEADRGNQLTTDQMGNIYLTGNFKDMAEFESGVPNLKLTSAGFGDAFVAKLNRDGQLIWVKQIGGNLDDIGKSILGMAIDQTGNIFTTGFFRSEADFDPGPDILKLTAPGIGGDVFISKLDSD